MEEGQRNMEGICNVLIDMNYKDLEAKNIKADSYYQNFDLHNIRIFVGPFQYPDIPMNKFKMN
jgi:hypothetical protein